MKRSEIISFVDHNRTTFTFHTHCIRLFSMRVCAALRTKVFLQYHATLTIILRGNNVLADVTYMSIEVDNKTS